MTGPIPTRAQQWRSAAIGFAWLFPAVWLVVGAVLAVGP